MTNITHSISVDIQKHAKRQVVYMKQGDAMSRELTISFYNDGAVWALPNDVTVLQLAYCKEDFVGGCYDHMPDNTSAFTINTGRTSATMKIHPQVLTVAGNVICELRLLNASAHVLNTFNFVINVEKSPIAMTSSSEGYYNNVFDGATFTPHVSDAGILSWTNNKNLPNPDPIDLKQFVVDPDDIPVATMEIVTSEDAVDNVNSDEKLITPAGVKKIVDKYGGAQNQVQITASYTVTGATAWVDNSTESSKGAFITRSEKLYICINNSTAGTWNARVSNYKSVAWTGKERAYDSSKNYSIGAMCFYGASSYDRHMYVLKVDASQGNLPTDTSKWVDLGAIYTVNSAIDYRDVAMIAANGLARVKVNETVFYPTAAFSAVGTNEQSVQLTVSNRYGCCTFSILYSAVNGTVTRTAYSASGFASE